MPPGSMGTKHTSSLVCLRTEPLRKPHDWLLAPPSSESRLPARQTTAKVLGNENLLVLLSHHWSSLSSRPLPACLMRKLLPHNVR